MPKWGVGGPYEDDLLVFFWYITRENDQRTRVGLGRVGPSDWTVPVGDLHGFKREVSFGERSKSGEVEVESLQTDPPKFLRYFGGSVKGGPVHELLG